MVKRTNLRSQNITKQRREVKRYGTQTPLSSTAVERGRLRFLLGSEVSIDGLLDVTGTLNGSGTNNFDGTNNLSGVTHITGPTDVAGDFEIIAGGIFKAGDTTINPDGSAQFGALAIGADGKLTAGLFKLNPDGSAAFGTLGIASDGTLTVRNDINITAGGKITAGALSIEPANGGQINFTGGSLSAGQFGALLNNLTAVELQAPVVRMRATTTEATGQLKVNSTPIKAASQLTPLGIDSNGVICRIG